MGQPVVLIGRDASSMKPYVVVPSGAGQIAKRPQAEYFTPIRLGPADYDARQIASTVAFNDLSAGLGVYQADSRQQANRSWLSTADTRWPNYISLPTLWPQASPPTPTAYSGRGAFAFVYSNAGLLDRMYFGWQNKLYRTTTNAWTLQRTMPAGAAIERLRSINFLATGIPPEEYLFVLGRDGAGASVSEYTTNGTTFTAVGTAAGGSPWVDIAQDPYTTTLVLVLLATGNVLTTDDATGALGTPVNHGHIPPGGHFLGTLNRIVYAVDGKGNLWQIDVAQLAGEVLRLMTDSLPAVTCGCVLQNAQLAVSDGKRVYFVHPDRPARDVTPGAPDGLPVEMRYTITGLFAYGDRLLASVRVNATQSATADDYSGVWELRGGSWHVLTMGLVTPDVWAPTRFETDAGIGLDVTRRRLWIGARDEASGNPLTAYSDEAADTANPAVRIQADPAAGIVFEDDAVVETGWHGLGLRGLEGPILRARSIADWTSPKHTVTFRYKLDGDDAADWVTLGQWRASRRNLLFAGGAGVNARSIRMRLELARNGGVGSPNAAWALDFLKVPDPLNGNSFIIDVQSTCRLQGMSSERLFLELVKLSGPGPLPAVKLPRERLRYLKLQAPLLTAYIDADEQLKGALQLNANEVI